MVITFALMVAAVDDRPTFVVMTVAVDQYCGGWPIW